MYTPTQRKILSIADEFVGETTDFIEVRIDDNYYYVYENGDILMETKEEIYEELEELVAEFRKIEKKVIDRIIFWGN
jgi:hypothetical protein